MNNIIEQNIKTTVAFFCLCILLTSCFKKDEQMFIVEPKAKQVFATVSVSNTIYNNFTYIDFDNQQVVKSVPISSWDLAFEASPTGWHILVNSANGREIYPTGKTDFAADYSATTVPSWSFDASSGNPDSTAVGKWVSGTPNNYQYTKQVYLLGNNNGDGTYKIMQKLSFVTLKDTGIVFVTANMNGTVADTVKIKKDDAYNYVYYSFDSPKKTLLIEPKKNAWDIVAGSYRTILYTDEGVPTPYTVRGVLSNYPKVKVAKINKSNFYLALAKDTVGAKFGNSKDAIGYDWKDYNGQSNNPYRIVPDMYYFMKTKSNQLVKFEFTGFINANAQYGYPVFTTVKF